MPFVNVPIYLLWTMFRQWMMSSDERRYEFIGEGKRYFDLVRMGKDTFVSTLKNFSDHYEHVTKMGANNPSEKDLLLPIPLTVMNIQASWTNNPGY